MAVKMRLTRLGDKKSPTYRIVVVDSRKARDGEYIDKIGHYNPTTSPAEVVIDADKAKDWLADNGYNEEFGARPLKRLIVQEVENPLSVLLLDGAVPDNSTLSITAGTNGLELKPATKH